MNDFSPKKIRLGSSAKLKNARLNHNLLAGVVTVAVVLLLYSLGSHLVAQISGSGFIRFFAGFFSRELLTDEKNHTNILVLGVGGEGHDGKDLTDTVIIASLNHKDSHISLISLPRDLYLKSAVGEGRINRLYETAKAKWEAAQGLDFVRETIQKTFDIPLHYAVKVDFEGFEKIIDAVGGVDVMVEKDIYDAEYPLDGTIEYEPFFIAAGQRHLNGRTALKYVRSRKTSSDFDRSKRQQQVLVALKEKAATEGLLTKKSVLKEVYYSLRDHVETNMTIGEMIALAEFAAGWDSSKMTSATMNNEPIFKGGFLYTPLREYYGGAYVLLPVGDNFELVNKFVHLTLYGPSAFSQTGVSILNGTKTQGMAGSVRAIFNRFGINMQTVGNARVQDSLATVWYVKNQRGKDLLPYMQELIPGAGAETLPDEYTLNPELAQSDLILELGPDAQAHIQKLDPAPFSSAEN